MNLKKKAGLALALAAIFTTGGANLALADNVTNPSTPVTGDKPTVIDFNVDPVTNKTGTVENLTVTSNVTFTEDMKSAIVPVKTMTVADSVAIPFKEIQLTDASAHLTLGKADSPAITASLNKVTLGNAGAKIDAVGGGSFSMTEIVGSTANASINIEGDSSKNQSTALTVGKLNASAALKINVGDTDGAGQLTVTGTGTSSTTLTGSLIFADPAWIGTLATGSEEQLAGSSTVTIASFAGSEIDGKLAAGRRSFFAVGTGDINGKEWMMDIIRDTELWGPNGTTAAFGLYTPSSIVTNGGIMVDGTMTSAPSVTDKSVTFADGSLYAVNLGGYAGNEATLTLDASGAVGIGSSTLPDSTTLKTNFYGFNPRSGQTYTILENIGASQLKVGSTTAAGVSGTSAALTLSGNDESVLFNKALATNSYWSGDNLFFSSDLFDGVWSLTKNGSNYDLKLKANYVGEAKLAERMPLLSSGMLGLVDDLLTVSAKDGFTQNAGTEFFYNILTADTISNAEKANLIEGAGQIAVAAGAPAAANNVITKISSLVVDHNNMLNATQPAYGNEPGKLGIWATPFYGMSDVDGMDAGYFESGYELNYGGAAFGLDYNINEAFRLGLALNVGGGDTESKGDFQGIENDFDFFGVSLYGSYSNGAFGLTGDLGFTGVDNEIKAVNALESNVDSDAFTLGLTGQYRFAASDNFNITPHLGLRYTKISVDDAAVNIRGNNLYKIATEDQNLFQIPLGVEFSSDIATDGGWTITPSADLGVLFTAGDTDVESRVLVPGLSGHTTNADANDSAAFMGSLGIKAAADNGLSLGLDYGILASGNQTDHQFSGMLRFEF